ncbi:hypothetical protein D3C86_1499710 [compost metagenome]
MPAGALEEHDHFPGDAERQFTAMVLFDQGQCQVHARRYARRGIEIAILNIDAILLDPGLRVLPGKAGTGVPMGGHATPIQQARCGEHEGATAHRTKTARRLCLQAQPIQQNRVLGCLVDMWAAGHKQGVDLALVTADGGIHGKLQAAGALDHPAFDADDFNPIGAWIAELFGCLGKDIGRADNVQQLNARDREKGDTHGVCPRRVIG